MKKHKSVVAILLSVMMIFTMMPMMAFAAEATGWGDHYGSVQTDETNGNYKTDRQFGTNGLITATATANKVTPVVGESAGVVPTEKGATATRSFYDTDGFYLVYDGEGLTDTALAAKKLDGTTWTQTAFGADNKGETLKAKLGFGLVAPSYVDNYNKTTPQNAYTAGFTGWKVEYEISEYDVEKKTEDQTITVKATLKADGEVTGSAQHPEILGALTTEAKITVKGVAKTPQTAEFYFDTVGGAKISQGLMYDGAAHTVVADEVEGYSVSYVVYNYDNGKFEPANAVSITDVQKEGKEVQFKATFTKGTTTWTTPVKSINLTPANAAYVGFKLPGLYTVKGSSYNADDYIVAVPQVTYSKYDGDTAKKTEKAEDAATAKAVEANKANIIAYIKELNDIVEESPEFNPNAVILSFDDKDLTEKERTEIGKKYATLLANFGESIYVNDGDYHYTEKATITGVVALNGVDLSDYEIEFTNAPAKKVIKTKKAKTTKKVTFNVTAECKNGTLVKYKLINAPKKSVTIDADTGKITVKKGLAKGTYTFKVKAYIPSSRVLDNVSYRDSLSEVQTIKIVVKKTKK